MRDPYNINSFEVNTNSSILELNDIPEYTIEDYDLNDPKDFKSYIGDIKSSVRSSFEYRNMVKFLRENMNMNACSIYENVNNIDSFKIKIELHHHPFSLHDLVTIVYRKRMQYGESLSREMVAKEVMYLHYMMYVGLLPLSQTVHELVHDNQIFIPIDKVMGRFKDFENMYSDFLDAEQVDKYERNIQYTESYIEGTNNVLNKKMMYIDASNMYDTPDMNTVVSELKQTLDDLRNTNAIEIVKYNETSDTVDIFIPIK